MPDINYRVWGNSFFNPSSNKLVYPLLYRFLVNNKINDSYIGIFLLLSVVIWRYRPGSYSVKIGCRMLDLSNHIRDRGSFYLCKSWIESAGSNLHAMAIAKLGLDSDIYFWLKPFMAIWPWAVSFADLSHSCLEILSRSGWCRCSSDQFARFRILCRHIYERQVNLFTWKLFAISGLRQVNQAVEWWCTRLVPKPPERTSTYNSQYQLMIYNIKMNI